MTTTVALMEMAKNEAAEAIPRFMASQAFRDEVAEAVLDSFHQGFRDFKNKAFHFYGLKGLDNIRPSLPFSRQQDEPVMEEPEPEEAEVEVGLEVTQDAPQVIEVTCWPGKEPTTDA